MFCPNCGSDNDAEKSYCRQCGQPLAAVRLAMDGRVDEAIKTLEGHQRVRFYRVCIVISVFLILIAISTIFTAGKYGFSNVQSAALILIIIVIFFMQLARKSHQVARVLDVDNQSEDLKLSQSITGHAAIGRGQPATITLSEPAAGSMTEQDTLKLKAEDQLRHD